jgi:transglutaminase-like putative cysteine protease
VVTTSPKRSALDASPRMGRTALLYPFPAALIVAGWLRLEERPAGWQGVWIGLLALAPVLVRKTRGRALLAVAAFLLAAHSAFSVSIFDARPFDSRHDFFGPLLHRFGGGVGDFYDVVLPFSSSAHPRMQGVALLAIFAFCLLLALAVASRRPRAASLALVIGAGWPATLLSDSGNLRRGTFLLLGVLLLLVGLRDRAGSQVKAAVFAAAAVALAAVAASSSSAVAKRGFVDWQHWDFYNRRDVAVSVRYVWNSNYAGIRFPSKTTTVLRVKAPPDSLYWRATTLDAFVGDRWVEDNVLVQPSATGGPDVRSDLLLPSRAGNRSNLVPQEITVVGLADRRLPAGSVPVAYEVDSPEVEYTRDGGALLDHSLERDRTYRVWSFAPQATPAKLARSQPIYPAQIAEERRYLTVQGSKAVPPFGARGRDALMAEFFRANAGDPRVRPYRALYTKARSVVGEPRSPYAAAVALESWFRSGGVFRYDEQPPRTRGVPPLVSFVLRTHAGYCQHFAGAMTLMLRYLGIPARVAAGFTSGRYDKKKGSWQVSDHDAHTWVEVWFRGYGWLPFDPTPGRGRLGASYTAASASFDVRGAARVVAGSFGAAERVADRLHRLALLRGGRSGERKAGQPPGGGAASGHGRGLVWLVVAVAFGLSTLVGTAKLVRRRARYLTSDPRKTARACRLELVEFLRDQRVEVLPSTTTAQLGSLVESEFRVAVRGFVVATTAARFGPPDEARDAGKQARHELRRVRRRIRSQLGTLERMRGLVSLRSLLQT